MFRAILIIGITLGMCTVLHAQKWISEAYFTGGSIWKHSKKIDFNTDVFCPGVTLHFYRNPHDNSRNWQGNYRGIRAGYSMSYRYLGKDFLGSALGLFASLEKQIIKNQRFELDFQLGSGLAFVTKKYDPEKPDDQSNDALSTGFNNITNFNLRSKFKFWNRHSLLIGTEFSHYSNGGYSLPNLGINVISGIVGITTHFDAEPMGKTRLIPIRKWRAFLGSRFSRLEWPDQGVGRRSLLNVQGGIKYIANQRAHWNLSVEYELNYALYWHGLDEGVFESKKDAYHQSHRWIISVGREFVFDQWSILLQSGLNLRQNIKIPPPKPIANVLGVKRYFLPNEMFTPYLGIFMKSHGSVAEYFGLGMGLDFL